MDAIIVLLGLVIGIVLFLAFMNCVTALVYNIPTVAITFGICWGIGVVLAWIAWRLALIVGIIALIIFIIAKLTKSKKNSTQESNHVDSNSDSANSVTDVPNDKIVDEVTKDKQSE